MAKNNLKRCPRCKARVKNLKRHLHKVHKISANARVGDHRPRDPTRGAFVTCEYCPASMHASQYAKHVERRHPGSPVTWRPALGAEFSKHGLSEQLKEALRRVRLPGYKQKYRQWFREVQGGAPGTGRRGR